MVSNNNNQTSYPSKKRKPHPSSNYRRSTHHSNGTHASLYQNTLSSQRINTQPRKKIITNDYIRSVPRSNGKQTPSYRNTLSSPKKNKKPIKNLNTDSSKNINSKGNFKKKITIGTIFLIITSLGIYSCISIFNPLIINNNDDTIYEGSYDGSGLFLNKVDAVLSNCDIDEQNALKTSGFTRIYYGSIAAWTKIYTIEGSPMLTQSFVDEVGEEIKRAFQPIIQRYPDRLTRVLDREGGTINFILVHGPADKPWGAYYNGEYMFAKRASARDLDIFHEIGHYFDMDDSPGNWRKHVDSVMTAEDIDIVDQYCTYFHPDGTPAYGEFVAEQYGKMFYPNQREQLKNEFPVVYERLLNYVPAPSSYIPFD